MSRRAARLPALALALELFGGCYLHHGADHDHGSRGDDAERAQAGAPAHAVTVAAAGSTAPRELRAPEVWSGELWSLDAELCETTAPFIEHGPPRGRTERVVLELDAGPDPAAPTGRIRIGEGEVPAEPSPEPGSAEEQAADWDTFYRCTTWSPARGGEYSLFDVRRSDDRLAFTIEPAEIWQSWCASRGLMAVACPTTVECGPQDEICPCGAGGCPSRVGQRLHFDFRVSGGQMEGVFRVLAQIRLRRLP